MENNISLALRNEKRLVIFAAVLLLVLSGPYFCWWITKNIMLRWIVTFALGFVFYKNKGRLSKYDVNIMSLYMITFIFTTTLSILKSNISFFGIVDSIPNLFLVYLMCANMDFCKKTYSYFSLFFAILMGLSIIAQIMFLLGLLPSIGSIVNPGQDRTYTVYPFLIREQSIGLFSIQGTRFAGAYDEPGAIGTIAAVLLCVENFRIRKLKNIIFLITGVMSMSLAFYVILVVYSFLYFLIIKKNIILTLAIIGSMGVFYNYTKSNPVFETLIWDRLEWDEEKQGFAGEDRMVGDADYYFDKHIKGTQAYWFGLSDTKEFWMAAEGSASYKVVIAQNGMIFLSLYMLCFILLSLHYKPNKFEVALFLILLIANTMQRPNIYSPLWIFLYAYYARCYSNKQKTINK